MKLQRLIIAALAITATLSSMAQVVNRSEFVTYKLRKDADSRTQSANENVIPFDPQVQSSAMGELTRTQIVEIPQSWVDASVFIHIQDAASAYDLVVNGRFAAHCEDSLTPSDYDITDFIGVGNNQITIIPRRSAHAELEEGVERTTRKILEGSYIYIQNKLKILDYKITQVEEEESDHTQLFIDVIVENRFNYKERIEVGFDIYDPAGKLLDFSTATATLKGNTTDTIRFAPHLYGSKFRHWNPSVMNKMQIIGRPSTRFADQPRYSLMLFTKRNRVSSDYIPIEVGNIVVEYDYDNLLNAWGKPINLKSAKYNALKGEEETEQELRKLKLEGYNTVAPSYPQPLWFYALCNKVGLYVIEQAAISAPTSADDKSVGGTPSNDPALVDEYLSRVQKMYYRTRNFNCIIAYSLGGESGNGYNMYKAYQWLKSVESTRPVIYPGAQGEWNNDPLTIVQ